VPLGQWRGMRFMTRKPSVGAVCCSCGHEWSIASRVTNTLAQEQGLASRLVRGGTKLEQFGATFTPGASGRRIAAGNEAAHLDAELAGLLSRHACPRCRSVDVHLLP
jgi:hypothetical protein